ncbi:MAG: methyl-accepting chemotaxis protein [Myxococcales bacterium]|nr:methyl-accepting chemotaxis protein [Myxococcales bacterium]
MSTTTQRKPRAKSTKASAEVEPTSETKISVFPLQRTAPESAPSELDAVPVQLMRLTPELSTSYLNARSRRCVRRVDALLDVAEEELFRAIIERYHEDPAECFRRLQDPGEPACEFVLVVEQEEWVCSVSRLPAEFIVAWHARTPQRDLAERSNRLKSVVEHAPIPMLLCSPDLVVESLNGAARAGWLGLTQGTGLTFDEAPGASLDRALGALSVDVRSLTLLSELPTSREVTLGDQRYSLRFTPVRDGESWVGTSVTWESKGDAVSVEQRISEAVAAERAVTRQLRADLDTMVGALSRVAAGELGLALPHFEEAAVQRVVDAVNHLVAGMRRSVNSLESTADTLAASADQLTNVGERMLSGAHNTRERSEAASIRSQDVHEHVLSVATSAEEMAASAREIAISASKAASVATHAVGVAESTSTTVNELAESSEAIGKVVKVINSIAEQTNLLALNATIEAARAGDAGKGFAVVANEVKVFAKETAKATLEIGDRIEAFQSNTQRVARAISEIGNVVNQIHNFQATIATAVEQQHAVTTEISQRALGAAESSADIAENTRSVQHAASSTASSAQETQVAARAVASTAFELKRIVSNFRA